MTETERQALVALRRSMQRDMFTLNGRIDALRESILSTHAGKSDPDIVLDSPELTALLAERRALMDAMPKASELGLVIGALNA